MTHNKAGVTPTKGRRSGWQYVRTASQVGQILVNDLQAGYLALRPELSPLLERLKRCGAAGVLMSGSGSTCFTMFATGRALERGQSRFQPLPDGAGLATRTFPAPTRAARGAWID